MVEVRDNEAQTPVGEGHTHTEVIREVPVRSRGGAGWAILAVLVLIAIVGAFLLTQGNGAEIAKDNAVAGAAESVGNAAESVGDAADAAADRLSN